MLPFSLAVFLLRVSSVEVAMRALIFGLRGRVVLLEELRGVVMERGGMLVRGGRALMGSSPTFSMLGRNWLLVDHARALPTAVPRARPALSGARARLGMYRA